MAFHSTRRERSHGKEGWIAVDIQLGMLAEREQG